MALNGADIYSGCCTLKIEYARVNTLTLSNKHVLLYTHSYAHAHTPTQRCCALSPLQPNRLNVVRNDTSSWDYTKPFLLHRGRTPPSCCTQI
ncbi:hypothetical protein CHARACLAT_032264 [Characodon lateralis]|uniref:Uncharacterized protein n=1 Tax=Characodon lateralis TaxID=208331 RepID=A0ABU7EIM5_9TELE|nr:hypothetical protein [Characodon lateralis]